jgi:hypothetical protein
MLRPALIAMAIALTALASSAYLVVRAPSDATQALDSVSTACSSGPR